MGSHSASLTLISRYLHLTIFTRHLALPLFKSYLQMFKYIFSTLVFTFSVSLVFSQATALWLRYPALSPDGRTIVFTYQGDIYRVDAQGGRATPITLHEAHDFMPVWSADGKSIAFASDRYGNFDVFTMPATGGEAKRITFHSNPEYPYAFLPDNKTVVFGASRQDDPANRQYPAAYMTELYKSDGGRAIQLLTTPAENVSFDEAGNRMFYEDRKGQENIWRKHHTSSVARDIWVYNMQDKSHKKLSSFAGENRNPVWVEKQNTLYYLSEQNGSFNVFKMNGEGGGAEAVTTFSTHPVRFLTAAENGDLCFGYNGEIYLHKNGSSTKVPIEILNDGRGRNISNLPIRSGISQLLVSPNGREAAFVYRGDVFVTNADGGGTKQVTRTTEAESGLSWTKDGRGLVYTSERDGRFRIFKSEISRKAEPYFYAATLINETELVQSSKSLQSPAVSPDGKWLAYTEDFRTLKVRDLGKKTDRILVKPTDWLNWGDNGHGVEWSPDSKWLLTGYRQPGIGNNEIGILSADGSKSLTNITQSGFEDRNAKWGMNGKMMYWFTTRDGLSGMANSGSSQTDVYALFFDKGAWDTFNLSKDDYALVKEIRGKTDSAKKKTDSKKDSILPVNIDWEGLEYRRERLTVHSSSMSDALMDKDGENLYYLSRFERGANLWKTNLRTKETKILAPINASRAGNLQWDKDGKNIFLELEGGIAKIAAADGKVERLTISSDMAIDARAERKAMFDHVVRRTRDIFYKTGYHGIKWDELAADYAKQVPHVGNNYEFAELLSELLGELNVSHSGATYTSPAENADATASLGLLYAPAYAGEGMQIEEVLVNGPLDKNDFDIKKGDILLAVDGDTVSAGKDLSQLLNRKTEKFVLVSIRRNNEVKDFVIKPISLADESKLLYQRWVKRNADEVTRLSNGKLGYIHIPGMNDGAYRSALHEAMGKFAGTDALVVDTRNNGGGDLVADLAMWLSGQRFMEYSNDREIVNYEPTFRWQKPSISLANEANYSDGHCYAYMYTYLKLGKMVGTPVPGTCTFAGWERLQNPELRWGVPPMGVKMMEGGYLENHQTDPDILVKNEYGVVAAGTDQQLEKAVQELQKSLN